MFVETGKQNRSITALPWPVGGCSIFYYFILFNNLTVLKTWRHKSSLSWQNGKIPDNSIYQQVTFWLIFSNTSTSRTGDCDKLNLTKPDEMGSRFLKKLLERLHFALRKYRYTTRSFLDSFQFNIL